MGAKLIGNDTVSSRRDRAKIAQRFIAGNLDGELSPVRDG